MQDALMTTEFTPPAAYPSSSSYNNNNNNNPTIIPSRGGADEPPVGAIEEVTIAPVGAAVDVAVGSVNVAAGITSAILFGRFILFAMLIVAFVMAIVAFCYQQDVRQKGSGLLGMWSYTSASSPLSVTTPLLLAVAPALAQEAESSFVHAPFDGSIETLSCEFNSSLSAGSALFTVMITSKSGTNVRSSKVCTTYNANNSDVFVTRCGVPSTPCNKFCKGDRLWIQQTTTGLVSTASPYKVTAQVYIKPTY